jgi:GNAT superfamily N-acetyltransferase
MTSMLRIGRARHTREHRDAILGLIDEAREWLPSKGTNQWRRPWPTQELRNARVVRALELGATWIVWEVLRDIAVLAATVTVTAKPNPAVWSPLDFNLAERTVYAHRLITARRYAGWDLGAELLDWTGRRGRRRYGAQWLRIDVWTDNEALHGYYMKRGFEKCGKCRDRSYPSGVLLQKRVSEIPGRISPQFVESDEVPEFFSAARPEDPGYAPPALSTFQAPHPIPEIPVGLELPRISQASTGFAEHDLPVLLAVPAGR